MFLPSSSTLAIDLHCVSMRSTYLFFSIHTHSSLERQSDSFWMVSSSSGESTECNYHYSDPFLSFPIHELFNRIVHMSEEFEAMARPFLSYSFENINISLVIYSLPAFCS